MRLFLGVGMDVAGLRGGVCMRTLREDVSTCSCLGRLGVFGSYLVVHTEESRSSLLRFLLIVGDVGISAIEGMISFLSQIPVELQKRFAMFRFLVFPRSRTKDSPNVVSSRQLRRQRGRSRQQARLSERLANI